MSSALSHIRVLDLSRILAGPWASQLLADLGAEVIKVENPDGGDDTRKWGPPYLNNESAYTENESAYFLSTNRGKQSVCVDIGSEEGQVTLQALVKECDVLIENFKAGSAKKYNLDFDTLTKINPALVYCSITGFGQTGPYKDRLGYDFLVQAMGGLMSVTGDTDENGGSPQKVGVALTDIMTGLYATTGILAALAERDKSGFGQHIDLALFDVTVATLANQASNFLVGGQVPERLGNAHPSIVPYQSFATKDGNCVIAVGNDAQFANFMSVLGCDELAQNELYITNKARVENRTKLVALIQEKMRSQTSDYWLAACEKANVPAGPINSIADVFSDPQILARGMRVSLPHSHDKNLEVVGNPLMFSRTPIQYNRPPPLLGEHTNSLLAPYLKDSAK